MAIAVLNTKIGEVKSKIKRKPIITLKLLLPFTSEISEIIEKELKEWINKE